MVSYEGSEVSAVFVDSRSTAEEAEQPASNVQHDRNVSADSTGAIRSEGSITPRPMIENNSLRPLSPRDRTGSVSTVDDEDTDIPPVPPLPDSYASLSPSHTPTSSVLIASPSSTSRSGILGTSGPSITKAETLKSKTVRDSLRRSISTREGVLPPPTKQGHESKPKGHWNANDLLQSIESDGVTAVPGVGMSRSTGGLRPPY
jgi:hypothetical protein